MSTRLLAHIRGNLVAYVALFFALAGTSVAATDRLLPRNSVGSDQVVNGSLEKIDLSKAAATALKGNRGARGQAGAQGAPGSPGPTGATGAQGPQGASGLPGLAGLPGQPGATGPKGDTGSPGAPGPAATPLVWTTATPAAGSGDVMKVLATIGSFTLRGRCQHEVGPGGSVATFWAASTESWRYQRDLVVALNDMNPQIGVHGAAETAGSEDLIAAGTNDAGAGNFVREAAHAVLTTSSGHVLDIDVHVIGDDRGGGNCSIDGSAVYAP